MQRGILTGPEIHRCVNQGLIRIYPFETKHINPASLDLTLGDQVSLYRGTYSRGLPELSGESILREDGSTFMPAQWLSRPSSLKDNIFDSKEPWPTDDYTMDPEKGWVLYPGLCYLMHTVERVASDTFVPILDGKSSVGRAFILVHFTAGYGDPGFDGQYTLEVTTQIPVRVYPGMRFCQIRFHTVQGNSLLYQDKGHYRDDAARGAVASKLYKQFD